MMPTDDDLDSMHHEDCYVRTATHVFKEPECNCPVRLVRELRDVLRRLVTAPAGISTVQFYGNGKVQLILTPEGGDAFSEARHLLGQWDETEVL